MSSPRLWRSPYVRTASPALAVPLGRRRRAARWLAPAGAVVGGGIAVVVLIGWASDTRLLTGGWGTLPAVKVNTALALVLLVGAATVSRAVRPAAVLAGLSALIGVLTLGEYAVGRDFGIDELLVRDHYAGQYPGRMSVVTAAAVVMLAAAVLLVDLRRVRAGRLCALAVITVSALVLLGWAYDVSPLHAVRPISAMAVPTAAALLAIATAVLAKAHPRGLGWVGHRGDPGALLVRRLLPVALLGLPLVGIAALLAEWAGWYGANTTAALTVVSSAVLLVVCVWAAGRRVSRATGDTRAAVDELTRLRVDLERQVAERAEQLQRRGTEIAVLEDRQRIAADLHDIVIQRLFAAGMLLHSAPTDDLQVRDRIGNAVEAMDAAINDLRTSIFELAARGRRPGIADALRRICCDSEPMLGFTPDLYVDDPLGLAELVRDDVLAVTREALANVARHAQAGAGSVSLRVDEQRLTLTITDDGLGLQDSGRNSGTANVVARAREHGGQCEWIRVVPSGTELRWIVPVGSAVAATSAS